MGKSLYLKLNQISEVHEKDVYLKDIATLYSDDSAVLNKCLALRGKKISSARDHPSGEKQAVCGKCSGCDSENP